MRSSPGDTALFALPPPPEPGRRGRRRRCGARVDADAVAARPASGHAIAGYAGRSARLRHAVCRPRFLKGVIVRVVWCELAKGSGWAKVRRLLSTDPTLSAPAIVEAYSKRWSIEPLFRDLKMIDGLGAMWQRGRTALLRWLHLVQIARTSADRPSRAADPCPDPPRWLATGGDADTRTGQGGARRTLPEFRGFPPVARNLPEIGTCTFHRPTGKRHGCLSTAEIQPLQGFNNR